MKCKWHLCKNEVINNRQYCSDKCKNKTNVTKWTKRRKLLLVEYKGGKCEKCGYNKCIGALVFHHKDPLEKDFQFSQNEARSKTIEELKKEADKCLLLCANCHAEEHEKIN
jgi:hypothetical protein